MLIRVRGYHDGVADYLVNGQKSGREYHRDELDERVILAGKLSATDRIIQSIDSKRERYKTITLSFKEDFVDEGVLRAITSDFKKFMAAAYQDDELNFYAEAHIPKIKSYTHATIGKLVERKPHIHIIVPKINLLTGKHADPFGYYELSEKYLEAFQEHINHKYGLASPKDNQRGDFTDASEFISRYKDDNFNGNRNKAFLVELREAVIQSGLVSMDQLHALLTTYGKVSLGKKGTSSEYFKVTLPGQTKAIRLEHAHFKREFIELDQDGKRRRIALGAAGGYVKPVGTRPTPDEYAALLVEWRELRAREAKYINSGYKNFYKQYKVMAKSEKIAELARLESRFYQKHLKNAALDSPEPPGGDLKALRAAAATIRARRASEGAKRPRASSRIDEEMRRRAADSVEGQYAADLEDHKRSAKAQSHSEFGEIKQKLQVARLIAYLSKSHGLIPGKYKRTVGNDGSERIRCGNRNLNVSDFLTKEMALPWAEASKILRECYAAQLAGVSAHYQQLPNQDLWRFYQQWKKRLAARRRATIMRPIIEERRRSISTAKQHFDVARSRIEAKNIPPAEKRLLIDIAKAERVHAQKAARDKAEALLAAIRQAWKGEELYRRFLEDMVQTGVGGENAKKAAMLELQEREQDSARPGASFEGEELQLPGEPFWAVFILTYQVNLAGFIVYKLDGQDALIDEGRRVRVLQADNRDVIEEGLLLARAKFGNRLSLQGDANFKRRVVEVAFAKGIDVEFKDPELQRVHQDLKNEKAEAMRVGLEKMRSRVNAAHEETARAFTTAKDVSKQPAGTSRPPGAPTKTTSPLPYSEPPRPRPRF